MTEGKNNKNKWLHLRLSEEEYKQVEAQFTRAKDRKLSAYVRKVLLAGPVAVTYYDQSLEDIVAVLTRLQNDLNGLANNYNQAVHKLHTLKQYPEYGAWILTYERDRKRLHEEVTEIKNFIRKTAEKWLQS